MTASSQTERPAPAIDRIHHVGLAVADLDGAVSHYTEALAGSLVRHGRIEPEVMHFALVRPGASEVELMHSAHPESPVGRFLAQRGPGVHHVAYQVEDLEVAVRSHCEAGCDLAGAIRPGVHGGRVAFLHPRSMGGVLTELVERA